MITGRAVPPVTTAVRFPPPPAPNLNPDPLTLDADLTTIDATNVRPVAARDRQRREHESMRLVFVRDSFAYNDHRIIDCLRHCQHPETGRREVADCVEIHHLPVGVKKGAHRSIRARREPDHLSRRVNAKRAALISP